MFKRKSEFKRYENELFSFEFPSYMACKSREEDITSFFKKRNPIGVIRLWYRPIDHSTETRQEIIDEDFEHAKENSFDDISEFNFADFSGVKWTSRRNTNPTIDGLYWRNGGIHPLFNKTMPDDPIQFALVATTLSTMLLVHWQFTNDTMTIDLNYRTHYGQTDESQIEMNKELALVEQQIKTIIAKES